MLEEYQTLFLEAMRLSLQGQACDLKVKNAAQLHQILHLASIHNILPMICEAVYGSEGAGAHPRLFLSYQKQAVREAVSQTIRTARFLDLLAFLEGRGMHPVVVKGLAVRCLYPKECLRLSVDEDLFIPAEEADRYHEAFLAYGLEEEEPGKDFMKEAETAYVSRTDGLYIEAHRYLFPPETKAYGDLNRFFAKTHPVTARYRERTFYTLPPSDHVFFLFCHSYKHFLHGGFGIRQISDLILYSDTFADQIDWDRILDRSRQMHADTFLKAIYQIGNAFLLSQNRYSRFQESWQTDRIDPEPLLLDVLAGGVHGTSEMARMHSSTITLNAVARQKEKKDRGGGILHSVFLPLESMKGRYRYLEKAPFLLPTAWMQRILGYLREVGGSERGGNSPGDVIRMGERRLELLERYEILDRETGSPEEDRSLIIQKQ